MYNTVGINNSSALALVRHNGDFYWKEGALVSKDMQNETGVDGPAKFEKDDGSFIKFLTEMAQSLKKEWIEAKIQTWVAAVGSLAQVAVN